MNDDLKQLIESMKEAVEKATPGPWVNPYDRSEVYQTLPDGEPHFESGWGLHHTEVSRICKTKKHSDGDFVATCDPANILALIAEIERLEREIADLKEHVADRDSILNSQCALVDCPVRRD